MKRGTVRPGQVSTPALFPIGNQPQGELAAATLISSCHPLSAFHDFNFAIEQKP
jgi:hypothetical protein